MLVQGDDAIYKVDQPTAQRHSVRGPQCFVLRIQQNNIRVHFLSIIALPNDFPSQIIIFESSPAEAKYLLSGDHETSVTSIYREKVEEQMLMLGVTSGDVKVKMFL